MLYCKLCQRDLTEAAHIFGSEKVKSWHKGAHYQDCIESMRLITMRVADVGWVQSDHVQLAMKTREDLEVLKQGIFEEDKHENTNNT